MRKFFFFNMIFILLLSFSFSASAQSKKHLYVGAKKCKVCHNSAKRGKQFKIWAGSPHANALKSLASEKAKKYAKENNIADPTTEAKCLQCHSTAASVDKSLIDPKGKLTVEEGVSCESCHGPGSAYKKMSTMKDRAKAIAAGLVIPTVQVCATCHNEKNPFHKPFDFKKYSTKIAHPIPKK